MMVRRPIRFTQNLIFEPDTFGVVFLEPPLTSRN